MTPAEIRDVVVRALVRVAPEVNPAELEAPPCATAWTSIRWMRSDSISINSLSFFFPKSSAFFVFNPFGWMRYTRPLA